MELFMDILAFVLKCFTIYTGLIGAFFLLPRRKVKVAPPTTRFAVLIAARNEENVIGHIVESLQNQDYPREKYDIFVIPNNCTDNTEGAARTAGARILQCLGTVRCKGDVLHEAFGQLMGKYDAYCVFDADNIVDSKFLARMNDEIAAGAQVAKSRQVALNPYDSWVAGCYDLYIANFNLMFSRPRDRLGLSAKLIGTGFMVTDALMHRLGGWNTVTLTEDAELAAQCAAIGERVHYVPEALTYDEEPLSFRTSLRQRRRWSAGIQDVANRFIPRFLAHPSWLKLDFCTFVGGIYLQLLALLPVVYALSDLSPVGIAKALAVSLVSFWVGMTATAAFLAVVSRRDLRKMGKSILLYPLFTASWYPLHILSLVAKPKSWKPIAHGTKRTVKQYLPQ